MKRKRQNDAGKNKKLGSFLVIGAGLLLLALVISGMSHVWGTDSQQQTAAAAPATAVDAETRYLGLPTDPEGLALAEAGQAGQPTLVWFHADWCHVCQQIKPDVVELGQEYEGRVKFVRLNVDDGISRAAIQRYGVRATPTFVLLDADGQVRGNVPGWPGHQAFGEAFGQLLPGS
jgi:thiol-disulfide isomerase/thioredoxin